MRMEKLTIKAQEGVQKMQDIAAAHGNQELTPEHLLLALMGQEDGIVPSIFAKLGVNTGAIESDLDAALKKMPKVEGSSLGQVYLSKNLNKLFDQATAEAEGLKDEFVSTEHFLLALANMKGIPAADILKKHGVNRSDVLKVLESVRGTQRVTDQNPEGKYQALKKFTRDLTDLARRGLWRSFCSMTNALW